MADATPQFLELPEGRIAYEVLGSGDGPPVLALHGGPGVGRKYLRPLAPLSAGGRPIVIYDQIGCGDSSKPAVDDPIWSVDLFADEVGRVREALRLDRVHLFGQSWGGMLAIEYMTSARPAGVVSLVLCDTAASVAQWLREMAAQRAALPAEVRAALDDADRTGNYDSEDFRRASFVYYSRHSVRGAAEWPPALTEAGMTMMASTSYPAMWGRLEPLVCARPGDHHATGLLDRWDRRADLGSIDVPTLITVGRYGMAPPACAETIHDGIPGARLVVFENSGHYPMLEEPERFLRIVGGFLDQHR